MPLFGQLSFGVLDPLAYILVGFSLIRIIASSRILVNFFRVSMLFEKRRIKVKHFSEETKKPFQCTRDWPGFSSGYF